MVNKSQNGWTAGTTAQIGGLDNSYVPGTKVKVAPGVRRGDVAVVLFYVAEQFNLRVQKLKAGTCWGYNYRPIRGATSLSNHASGTAIDLNADKHPLGTSPSANFSAAQITAIHKIVTFCEGAVRWGGDYTGRKDPMHFEINANAAKVKKVADKIRALDKPAPTKPVPPKPAPPKPAPPKPAPPKPTPLKLDGDLGPATIKRWQQVMGTAADGKISEPSELVKAVQRHLNAKLKARLTVDGKGLAQNGKVTNTIKALQRYLKVSPTGAMSKGKSSPTIVALQKKLNAGSF